MRTTRPSAVSAAGKSLPDDRLAKARIRDAAIASIAESGLSGTTVRGIAARAGVSPGLVIHHFGSMQGLRGACDTFVAAVVRQEKQRAVSSRSFDLMGVLRNSRIPALAGYLANVLGEDSPTVDALVDDLIADARAYLEEGVEAGTLKPTDDPATRAAVLAVWSLGSLVLHKHLLRQTGVDPINPGAAPASAMGRYVAGVVDILSEGIYAPSFAEPLRAGLAVDPSQPSEGRTP